MKLALLTLSTLVILVGCSSMAVKDFGVISTEQAFAASIDTTGRSAKPITLTVKLFKLTNQSTDKNITFLCKCYLVKADGFTWGKIEKYTVAPKETVVLEQDSSVYGKAVRYQVVGAFEVAK